MDKARTLKEWRELRGISREELAEQAREDLEDLARWEEVGYPFYSGTKNEALFVFHVLTKLAYVLEIDGYVETVEAPTDARPGDLVLSIGALLKVAPDVFCSLADYAEEIGLRVAVPNRWDIALKRSEDVVPQDWETIVAASEQDSVSDRDPAAHLGETMALFLEHSMHEDDWLDDVLEWRDGKWRPKKPRLE